MNLARRVSEVFDLSSGVPYRITFEGDGLYSFSVEGVAHVFVTFTKEKWKNEYDVTWFWSHNDSGRPPFISLTSVDSYINREMASGKNSKELDRLENAQKVMQRDYQKVLRTVFIILSNFIEEHSPDLVTFAAIDPDLLKLYSTLIRRYLSKFTEAGYKVTQSTPIQFSLRRIK